jgi:hypothetical protein
VTLGERKLKSPSPKRFISSLSIAGPCPPVFPSFPGSTKKRLKKKETPLAETLTWVGAVGGQPIRALESSEVHPGPWGALSPKANAPDLNCVVAVFSQAPEGTGSSGSIHLPDHTLPRAILPLQVEDGRGGQQSPQSLVTRLNWGVWNIQALQGSGGKHQLPDSSTSGKEFRG